MALLFEGERAIPTPLRETEVSQTVSTPPPAEEERGRAHLETFSFPSALCFTFSLFSSLGIRFYCMGLHHAVAIILKAKESFLAKEWT